MKEGLGRAATQSELEELTRTFGNYARVEELTNLENDMKHLVRKEELNLANDRIDNLEMK